MSFYGDHSQATPGEVTLDSIRQDEASEIYDEARSEASKQKDQATGIENLNKIPWSLRLWNIVACAFMFAQAVILGYFASQATTDWYLYTNFPANFGERDNAEFGRPSPNEIAAYSVTWYSCAFMGLAGLDHLIVSFPGFVERYEYYIARHQNPFRWTEYAFSASLMRVMIAQLSGVTDVHLLFTIFMLAATTMLLGSCHESVNAVARADGYRQNWYPFLAAFLPHLSSWAVIFCYFFVSVSKGDPPAFVWAIIIALFVLDGVFALLFFLQWAKIGCFRNYVTGEIGFIILSFTAKGLLAWLNYVGGTR